MAASIVFVSSPLTGLRRHHRREPGVHVVAGVGLRFLLSTHYRWNPTRDLEVAVNRLEELGKDHAIRPVTFKRELRSAHAKLFSRNFAAEMDEIDSFLSGSSRSWSAIETFGRSLCDRFAVGRKRSGTVPYFAALGELMMFGQTLNALLDKNTKVLFPAFCEFCWRVTLTSQKYCRVHSTFGSPPAGLLSTPNDDHWLARRLSPAFETHVLRQRTVDKRTKAVSKWLQALKDGGVVEWLACHRPKVYAATAALLLGSRHDQVRRLVAVLDQAPREQPGPRAKFHEQLSRPVNERDVFEMALRAEAWLSALEERRGQWGGARQGAGRKRSVQDTFRG